MVYFGTATPLSTRHSQSLNGWRSMKTTCLGRHFGIQMNAYCKFFTAYTQSLLKFLMLFIFILKNYLVCYFCLVFFFFDCIKALVYTVILLRLNLMIKWSEQDVPCSPTNFSPNIPQRCLKWFLTTKGQKVKSDTFFFFVPSTECLSFTVQDAVCWESVTWRLFSQLLPTMESLSVLFKPFKFSFKGWT